jgi:hypothetical protein
LPNTFAASFNPLCVGNPGPVKLSGPRKVIQLTGDMDLETQHITPNQTGKNFGIYGTDLGVSFLHDDKLYFLFGDTTRISLLRGVQSEDGFTIDFKIQRINPYRSNEE